MPQRGPANPTVRHSHANSIATMPQKRRGFGSVWSVATVAGLPSAATRRRCRHAANHPRSASTTGTSDSQNSDGLANRTPFRKSFPSAKKA